MEPEVELDFFDIVKDFNEMEIKYLINPSLEAFPNSPGRNL